MDLSVIVDELHKLEINLEFVWRDDCLVTSILGKKSLLMATTFAIITFPFSMPILESEGNLIRDFSR